MPKPAVDKPAFRCREGGATVPQLYLADVHSFAESADDKGGREGAVQIGYYESDSRDDKDIHAINDSR